MRRTSVVLMAAVLGVGGLGLGHARGADFDAIQEASDPAQVMLAYRSLGDADKAAGEEIYVRRMGELGLPDMVLTEAQEIVQRKATNSGAAAAWAVIAENKARHGELMGAVSAVSSASTAMRGPDPLVERTAGRILAWADSRPEAVPPEAHNTLERIRSRMNGRDAFNVAYNGAGHAYGGTQGPARDAAGQVIGGAYSTAAPPAPPSTQPIATDYGNNTATPEGIVGVPDTGATDFGQQYVYTLPAYVPTYPSYDYYGADYAPVGYPYPYWDGYWPYWGWGGSVVIFNNGHNHGHDDHFHDHGDHFHDGHAHFGWFNSAHSFNNGIHGGFGNTFGGGFRPGGFGGLTVGGGFLARGNGAIGGFRAGGFGGGFRPGGFGGSTVPGGFHGGGMGGGFGGGMMGGGFHGGGFGGGGMGGGFGGGMGGGMGGGHR